MLMHTVNTKIIIIIISITKLIGPNNSTYPCELQLHFNVKGMSHSMKYSNHLIAPFTENVHCSIEQSLVFCHIVESRPLFNQPFFHDNMEVF